jgi:hypothetical protein
MGKWASQRKPDAKYDILKKIKMLRNARLDLRSLIISCVFLLPFEFLGYAFEKFCTVVGLPGGAYIFVWTLYHKFVVSLLYWFYFRTLNVRDPWNVLKRKKTVFIFASNHPAGLSDRRTMQYLVPACKCVVAVGSVTKRRIEQSLHVTSGNYRKKRQAKGGVQGRFPSDAEQFATIVDCLCTCTPVWLAAGGGKELHPYIGKVHTGAVRVGILARERLPLDRRILIVPTHLAFECDKAVGSDVLVEFGEPIEVGQDWELGDRALVRRQTQILEKRLRRLNDYFPVPSHDDGAPGQQYSLNKRKGPGEKKQAYEEWLKVRLQMSMEYFATRRELPWEKRVDRLRTLKEGPAGDDKSTVCDAFLERYRQHFSPLFTEVLGHPPFTDPPGVYWDTSVLLMTTPKRNFSTKGSDSIGALRNFTYGAPQWEQDILNAGNQTLIAEYGKLVSIVDWGRRRQCVWSLSS